MWVVLAYVLSVFLRNPVGTESLGSNRVGGKPYVDVIIAYLGYWVLARASVGLRQARFVPLLTLFGTSASAALNFLSYRLPWLVGPISMVYAGIAAAENNADMFAEFQDEGARYFYLQGVGISLTNAACSLWRPLTLVNPLHFRRFVCFMLGIGAILLSGFRSGFFGVAEIFLLSSYFRGGWREAMRVTMVGGGLLVFIMIGQGRLFDLPYPAQRALSFLPGKWDESAKMEAQGSTEWRLEMWEAMLTGNKYIQNKWLGDGFGFTHQQLEIMTANMMTGTTEDQQENLMINGGVHSGPVTAIRYVGYIGLLMFLIFLVLLACYAVRLIRRARGTPLFPVAFVFGAGLILYPFNYVFIFGSFDGDLPNAIMSLGYLKLIQNSLDAYEATTTKKSSAEVIQPPKFRPIRPLAPAGGVA
jgi:hypothetical protein